MEDNVIHALQTKFGVIINVVIYIRIISLRKVIQVYVFVMASF